MADYNEAAVSNAVFAHNRPGTFPAMRQLRDNMIAMFEGAAGARRLADLAMPDFAAGDTEILNVLSPDVVGYTDFISGGSASGTYYAEKFAWHAIKAGGLRISVQLDVHNLQATGSHLRVQRNGTTLATLSGSSLSTVQTADITFSRGDLISLQHGVAYTIGSGGGTATSKFRNLKILADQRGVFRL